MKLGTGLRRAPRADVYKCRHVARVLQGYLDGEVDDETVRKVSVHLASCQRCGFEADAYREIIESLGRSGPVLDPDVIERLGQFADQIGE